MTFAKNLYASHSTFIRERQSVADPGSIKVVYSDWLLRCHQDGRLVSEADYTAQVALQTKPPALPPSDLRRKDSFSMSALSYQPSGDSSMSQKPRTLGNPAIMRRRSDASSMPLRPDGVFKGLSFSVFGWSDPRLENSLQYQLTSNGATIVRFVDDDQYACVCADGSRPTAETVRLVSSRWVNDCLAQETLIDPQDKAIYTPSRSQLPMLLATKVVLYITEKDTAKFDEIAGIAKLCGIKYVSRSEARVPVSAVTHFIFHDAESMDRRRDLVPLARKNGKHIVTYGWLQESYLLGQLCEESRFDLSITPALCAPSVTDPQSKSE